MKKIITVALASLTILSGSFVNHQADAKTQTKINYLSKNTAKKILAGTFSYEGLQVGKRFTEYDKNKKYGFVNSYFTPGDKRITLKKYADTVFLEGNSSLDRPFGHSDFQEKVPFSKEKISRLQIFVRSGYKVTPTQMQKYYGKPKYSAKSNAGCCRVRADIYNSATLYYYIPFTKSQPMTLAAIDMYKYKNTAEMKKFVRYLNKNGVDISYTITKSKWK
ncbi:hypothetical protein [Macrococcoides bohemicum]|uniref:hypothetical protein n=1 Tax=Macrococcoides bohemicum TaxID=1903056 RepID=UPI00165DB5AC|nr:hypothetical protein [Macrococcus bohemicus]MBC9875655.1 hypothetical protein [Macrococcus bohemicus]